MDFYEYIEDYCEGQLNESTKQAFEEAMAMDSHLADLVKQYPDGKKIAEGLLEMDMMATLDALKKDKDSKKSNNEPIRRQLGWTKWAAAATVVCGMAVGGWFLTQNNSVDSDVLFAELYEEPIWPIERGVSENIIGKASSIYLSGDLVEAKRMLQDSLTNKALARFWIAEMYLKEGQLDSTLLYLPSPNDLLEEKDRIIYVKMLIELKKGNIKGAKQIGANLPKLFFKKVYEILDI